MTVRDMVHGMFGPIPSSYRDARAQFLRAASDAGCAVRSTPHPLTGLHGEDLAVDVATLGPADADDVVVIVSGTHGVEGYLGSTLQHRHLVDGALTPPNGAAVVLVHALNPHGFSWVRRVNEDNVDLNRNFIDWDGAPPPNAEYGELADVLVPTDWTEPTQERTFLELMANAEELGFERLQEIITKGQYAHPTGVFHGGTGPTWSNHWLSNFLGELGPRRRVAVLDLHTGIGPSGHCELISCDPPDSAEFGRQSDWWGTVTSMLDGSSVSAELEGNWQAMLPSLLDADETTAVALEYGTVDGITVLQSLRADAVLHAFGDPTSPEAEPVRNQVRAAFCDDDPAWLETCWNRYAEVVAATLQQLGDS